MITSVHALVYADDAGAARDFFRDVLGWPHVDVHDGWLIFKTGPSELAVHPTSGTHGAESWKIEQHHEITKGNEREDQQTEKGGRRPSRDGRIVKSRIPPTANKRVITNANMAEKAPSVRTAMRSMNGMTMRRPCMNNRSMFMRERPLYRSPRGQGTAVTGISRLTSVDE